MTKHMSEFEELLVEYYRKEEFSSLTVDEFNQALLSDEPIVDSSSGERLFVLLCKQRGDTIHLLFRPVDADLIDIATLEDELDDVYHEGECVGYDLQDLVDGQIMVFFNPNYHRYIDPLQFVSIMERAVFGITKTPDYVDED